MSPRFKGRQAIYIGTPPVDWSPTSLWSVPPSLDSVVCYQKNLPMSQALAYARTFNKTEKEKPKGARRWAIVSRHLRASRPGEHPEAKALRREERRRQMREEIRAEVLAEMKGGVV